MTPRENIIQRIVDERARQFNLPGREFDVKLMPNDWISLVTKYLARGVASRPGKQSLEDFTDDLIKAAAIIVAACEHAPFMVKQGAFSDAD